MNSDCRKSGRSSAGADSAKESVWWKRSAGDARKRASDATRRNVYTENVKNFDVNVKNWNAKNRKF